MKLSLVSAGVAAMLLVGCAAAGSQAGGGIGVSWSGGTRVQQHHLARSCGLHTDPSFARYGANRAYVTSDYDGTDPRNSSDFTSILSCLRTSALVQAVGVAG